MIQITEIKNPREWKKDLNNFEFSIFIIPEWIECFADSMKAPVYFNFNKGNIVVGKIAGLIINYKDSGARKLFFFAGPAFPVAEKGIVSLLLSCLTDYAIRNKFKRLIVKSYDYKTSCKFIRNDLKTTDRCEYIIDLRKSIEEIQSNYRKLVLRKVKKSEKSNAEFVKGDSLELIDCLISLLEETKRIRLSKGYSNYSYFYIPYVNKITLNKIISNKITSLYYVKAENEITCISLILAYNKKAYAFLIGANTYAYKLGIPYFLMYRLINELKRNKFVYFNLGGIPADKSGKGLIFFKESLGAKKVIVTHCSTNYLTLPHMLLNPLLNIGRKLPDNAITRLIKHYF